jgi:hypothetical protein
MTENELLDAFADAEVKCRQRVHELVDKLTSCDLALVEKYIRENTDAA